MFLALNRQTELQGRFFSNSWYCLDGRRHGPYLCVLEGTEVCVEVTVSVGVCAAGRCGYLSALFFAF